MGYVVEISMPRSQELQATCPSKLSGGLPLVVKQGLTTKKESSHRLPVSCQRQQLLDLEEPHLISLYDPQAKLDIRSYEIIKV